MRICMLSYSFYEDDSRILQYAGALVERGDTVDVIALRKEGATKTGVLDGVNVYRIQTRVINEKGRISYLLRIVRFLAIATVILAKMHLSKRYSVVHVHSVPDFLVFAALIPRLLGASVILDIHDILPEFYASKFGLGSDTVLFRLLLLMERVSAVFADHVIVANELWQAKLISRSVPKDKCTAIRNYPDASIFSPRPKPAGKEQFLLMYPGSLNRHQGLDVAIRAFSRVAVDMPNAEFWIYGEGPEKPSLQALSKSLGLSGRVYFRECLPLREIAAIMATCDLAVVPKRTGSAFGSEAASTKIMEFMSLGVPVIVSRTRIDTFYHDDSMVKFVESENEADLASAIFLLWQSPELRQKLAENGSRYVQENNWARKKIGYLSLIDSLASRSHSRVESESHA